jgi:tetratricopeptide (TPR) repeat protein
MQEHRRQPEPTARPRLRGGLACATALLGAAWLCAPGRSASGPATAHAQDVQGDRAGAPITVDDDGASLAPVTAEVQDEETALAAGLDPYGFALETAAAQHRAGEFEKALVTLNGAVGMVPPDFDAQLLLWRGRVLNDLGRFEEALVDLEVIARKNAARGVEARLEHVRALRGVERPRDAERILRNLLQTYPLCGPARISLVELLFDEERFDEADAELGPLIEQAPQLVWAQALRARLFARRGDVQAGIRLARDQAGLPDPTQTLRAVLVELLLEAGRDREAWLEARPLVQRAEIVEHLELAARAAESAEEPLEALTALTLALRLEPGRASVTERLWLLLMRSNELSDRLALDQALSAPEDPAGWARVLRGRIEGGRSASAVQVFDGLSPALRDELELKVLALEALRLSGDFARAMQFARELCERDTVAAALAPGAPVPPAEDRLLARAWYERALLEFGANALEEAARSFARGASSGWAPQAQFNRGVILEKLGRFREAATAYEAATAADDAFLEAWLQLGHSYRYRLGRAEAARTAYRRYLDLGGDDPEVRSWIGRFEDS